MALLPPEFLDTVVAIGIGDNPNSRHWIGTGFIFGNLMKKNMEDGKNSYHLWLITNKHVFEGQKEIYLKFNSLQNPDSKDYYVSLLFDNGRPRWVGHPSKSIDIAAIALNPKVLRDEDRLFFYFRSDQNLFSKDEMVAQKISEGDRIFVLGFPMGLVDKERQYVICRGGYIARIRDYLEDRTNDYLIDALVFPGNSGGPVILCPAPFSLKGTTSINRAVLIGIVKAYIPYRDVAVSPQTRAARILFQENSGLAAVESASSILETVQIASRRMKERIARAQRRANKK